MKIISKNSGLSTKYTNHCLRGTTATAMYKCGYSLHDIAQVTRHKNLESLKYYLAQPTITDMENYSNSLFDYTGGKTPQNGNSQSDEDFETPPVPTKNMYQMVCKEHTKQDQLESYKPSNPSPS